MDAFVNDLVGTDPRDQQILSELRSAIDGGRLPIRAPRDDAEAFRMQTWEEDLQTDPAVLVGGDSLLQVLRPFFARHSKVRVVDPYFARGDHNLPGAIALAQACHEAGSVSFEAWTSANQREVMLAAWNEALVRQGMDPAMNALRFFKKSSLFHDRHILIGPPDAFDQTAGSWPAFSLGRGACACAPQFKETTVLCHLPWGAALASCKLLEGEERRIT